MKELNELQNIKHKQILDVLNSLTDEELKSISAEVKAMNLGGVTIEEYLGNFNQKTHFSRGFICACALIVEMHGLDSVAEDILGVNYLTIKQMRAIGVDEHDIKTITPIVKEIERKKRLKR